ncbi:uncharacterized protein C8A04DRAFT_36262 [Dichotomopilus funicola]|uniref:Uncharacterized protein n=1 Tax=Dichotomopilus funicola TaxID=1934379 RepID=A0AAN6ZPV6_9PEZI|nr:hypothetical protein C8A04DRAFT_36262 [Dichotomopilus funicola]
MATRFEMLDKQLDRLERLFARKKRVTEFDDNSEVARKRPATPIPFSPRFDATSMSFPQPSYIRPTSSRMMAREEISMAPQYIRRARSLPEASNTPSLGAPAPENESTTAVGDVLSEFPAVPSRQPSIAASIAMRSSSSSPQARSGRPSPELMEFTFSPSSAGPDSDSSATGRRSRTGTRTPIRTPSVSPKAQSGRTRYFTGAQESPISPASLQQKLMRSPKSSLRKLLAPPLSARPTLSIRTKLGDDGKNINRSRSLSISGANARDASEALRKSISLSNLFALAPSNPDTASFKEPSLNDFLALSDDDIADGENTSRVQPAKLNPPTFGLPSSPSPTASPVRSKPAHPLLTLSPPLASRPAAAAAFEAARIATKYQFDLVYVVNLWPSHMSRPSHSSPLSRSCGTPVATSFSTAPTPSPPESPVSQVSEYDSSHDSRAPTPRDVPRSGITGRLLAAYGLTSLMNPFRISAPAHQKMLRTSDWLKYNNYTGIKDEFACGYGRSFYTGHSAARGSDAQHTTTAQHKNQPANRGIVFAAFRVPREDGEPISLNPQELEELHQDAQALVDMLIDMHMTPRRSPTPISATPSRRMMGPSTPLVTA